MIILNVCMIILNVCMIYMLLSEEGVNSLHPHFIAFQISPMMDFWFHNLGTPTSKDWGIS